MLAPDAKLAFARQNPLQRFYGERIVGDAANGETSLERPKAERILEILDALREPLVLGSGNGQGVTYR